MKKFFYVFLMVLLVTSRAYAQKDVPLALNSLSVNPRCLKNGEKTSINLQPTKACIANIYITDRNAGLVKYLAQKVKLNDQLMTSEWDGTGIDGHPVANGVYYYIIELTDDQNQKFIYNPYQETYGKQLNVVGEYDPLKSEIRYKLPQSAFVNMRIGVKSGAIMSIPMDWDAQLAGEHIMPWDGKDSSGYVLLDKHPGRTIQMAAYSMAENSIIVQAGDLTKQLTSNSKQKMFKLEIPADRYIHALHNFEFCLAPKVELHVRGESPKDQSGYQVVSGIVSVELAIISKDWARLENSRYGLIFYVDTVPIFKEYLGYSPFVYQWDTSQLPPGNHLLTVNVVSYDDHIGIDSLMVKVQSQEGKDAK